MNFYLQIGCGKDDKYMRETNNVALMNVCLGIAGCLIFIVSIQVAYRWNDKLLKRQFQSISVSAKEYTLEIELTSK